MKVSSAPQIKLNMKYKPMKESSAPQTKLNKIQTSEGELSSTN